MLIRVVREEDWEACLDLDLSYETESAWQMEVLPGGNVWGMSFREIHLPRKQRVEHPLALADPLKSWQSRDNFWVAVEKRVVVALYRCAIGVGAPANAYYGSRCCSRIPP